MCLTIPGKITKIKDGIATVKNANGTAQIDMGLVFGAKVGNWVLYATDRAVKLISARDAKEIISLLEDHYHPVDVSKLPLEFKRIIFKVRSRSAVISTDLPAGKAGVEKSLNKRSLRPQTKLRSRDDKAHDLTKEEIEYLLNLKGKDNLETLFAEANSLRKETIEDFVCIHGIIEFSNYCKNNCLYCGIRKENRKLKRYRMTETEIIKTAKDAVEDEGYKLLVLQSGEDDFYSDKMLINLVKKIKSQMKVFIFLSVGERSERFYKNAWRAGATGSLIRFETSNAKLYAKLRPKHRLGDRVSSIKYQVLRGYYIASGSMVGLPGQSISDIANDLLMIKKLGIPMISAGPWLPAKGTPLAQFTNYHLPVSNKLSFANSQLELNDQMKNVQINGKWKMENEKLIELMLKFIAVARFMMPEIKIPVTTALETLDPENGRHRGLLAGANALMFNLTPEKYAGKYSIYDNKYREREKVWQKYGLFQGEESWEMLEDRLYFDEETIK